jgi:iron complex outermembrane receptor protein
MKLKTALSLSLMPVTLILGQADKTNVDTPMLDEIGIKGNQLGELDLSRATILNQDTLESRQVNSLEDLNGLSPNLHLSGNGIKSFGDVLTMRGIGNTQFFGSPGVQMYIDGVPQGNVFSYGSDLYGLEAIEVLKGPQGSRFGKLAPGGAINLVTKKPGKKQTSKVSASYATFNTQKYNISSSGPMDEQFSYSLGIQRALSDGFLNNTSGRNNDSETWNGRLSFHWDGGTGTKATLGASFTSHELGAQPLVLRNQADFYARSVDEDEFTEIDQNQQFLKLEHETETGTITSITSRNDWDMNPNKLDIDLSNLPFDSNNPLAKMISTISQDQQLWSQELRFNHTTDNDLSWTIGGYLSEEKIDGLATRDIAASAVPYTPPYFPFSVPTSYVLESENYAGFFIAEKTLTKTDSLSLLLRYDHFEKSMIRTNMGTESHNESKDFSSMSGNVKWAHSPNNSTTYGLVLGYSEKPGGYSAFTSTPGQEIFSDESIVSYEAFLQLNSSESWQVNLTAFFNDIEDYQFELNGVGMDYYLENADEVSIYGLEIDSIWNLGGGWSFGASYGLTESEFKKVTALPALVGKHLPFVPDHSLSLVLGHELDNGLSYQIGSRTTGKTHFWDNTGSNTNDVIDSYTLLEAQIGYAFNDWNFNLFGTNLTKEEYYTSLVSNLKSPVITDAPGIAGSPRVIGLSISKEF